jgi:hypothetical protein
VKHVLLSGLAVISSVAFVAGALVVAQTPTPQPRSVISQSLVPPPFPQKRVDDALIEFPLAPGQQKYASIDGKKMHTYVVKLADIARKYRDNGHPKFWGRITGTSADHETTEWLVGKYKEFGLTDVRVQEIPLQPQWMAQDWKVEVVNGGQTVELTSAQPAYDTGALPPAELDAVWVGRGSEADFMGRDVKGKAVFVETAQAIGNNGAVARAGEKGAAVVFDVSLLPGNMRTQSYPARGVKTAFSLGNDDGNTARTIIEKANGQPVKVKVRLAVDMTPNMKTALIWGTLPGATDETIYITAHRDGWFDAATDNASGVASQLGLAEYFGKIPQAQRKRTIVFVSLDGHHNGANGSAGHKWLAPNLEKVFTAKTALIFNNEHPAQMALQTRPRYYPGNEITWSNTYLPLQWFAGGKVFPELKQIAWNAFKEFGQSVQMDESPASPASDLTSLQGALRTVKADYSLQDNVALLDAGEYHEYFHTDWETPEQVPWTGLQASTRAFAKIIEEVNKIPLEKLNKMKKSS